MPEDIAKILYEMIGIIKEHWRGETECRTDEDYLKECAEMGKYFPDEDYDPVQAAAIERISQIKAMLNLCGIGYGNYKESTPKMTFMILCVMKKK